MDAAEGKRIDMATIEDEIEASTQDTILASSPPKEKEAYKTQCRPTCSKISKNLYEGTIGRKSAEDKTKEKATRATSPFRNPVKITEVDLVSDTEEEKEKPSKEVGYGGGALQVTQNGFTIEVKIQNGVSTNSTTINLTSEATKRNLSNNK